MAERNEKTLKVLEPIPLIRIKMNLKTQLLQGSIECTRFLGIEFPELKMNYA